jgi:hypothetical protein
MRRMDRRSSPGQGYRTLAEFYGADTRRIHSRELDFGLWWRETLDSPLHRAAWVQDTGELYMVRLGPSTVGGGEVEVLATLDDRERLESMLEGWRERCGEPRSLTWLRSRAAFRRRASADTGPAHPPEPAPTGPPSRGTAGTAVGFRDRDRVFRAAQRPPRLTAAPR